LGRQLRARTGLSEITLKEEEQRHRQKLAEIQALSGLSGEALVAAAPADRAAMLTELKKTEALKSFTEDQILAMAAKDSPEVARAFQEKFQGASAEEIQKVYERMLVMKDQGMTDVKEMSREYARMMQEMYNRGMDTQRDTATAAARTGQPGMTVITPGMGSQGVVQTGSTPSGAASRVVICPNCHKETEEGNKFCENCGHKFFS
jgi:hypothetical protein